MHILRSLFFLCPLMLAGCSSLQTAEASSYGGRLSVEAQVSGGHIVSYQVTSIKDSPVIYNRALPVLEARILKAGHPMVDAVSGATYTSRALQKALAEAQSKDFLGYLRLIFTQDTTNPSEFLEARRKYFLNLFFPKDKNAPPLKTDILIVGGGAAGMAAALAAKEQNPKASVTLIEKLDILGGNAKFARNLFDIVQSEAQKKAGIKDSAEQLYQGLLTKMRAYEIPVDPARIKTYAQGSAAFDAWLRRHGIALDYLYDRRGLMAGRSGYAGTAVIGRLEALLSSSGVELKTGTSVRGIDFSSKTLTLEDRRSIYRIEAKSIILAAGGFAANSSLVLKQNPDLEGFDHSNSPGNTGEILILAEKNNLPLDGMEFITLFDYALAGKELTGDSEEDTEFILVNTRGERFVDEFGEEDIPQAIKAQPLSYAYMLFDERSFQTGPRLQAHIISGKGHKVQDAAELEQTLKTESLVRSLRIFNEEAESQGRRPLEAPFYALKVRSLIHMTRGGLRVDAQSRLLDAENKAVPGFFAAGEVTDMPFAALLGSFVFGIEAGRSAAQFFEAGK